MKRCSECLSTIEDADKVCPQCGTSFTRSFKGLGRALGGLALVAVAGFAWWMWENWPQQTAAETVSEQRSEEPDPQPPAPNPAPEVEETPAAPRRSAHHLALEAEGSEFHGVLLSGAQLLVFIQFQDLPLQGELKGDPGSLEFDVATYDADRGFALLASDAQVPGELQPLTLGDFTALAPGSPLQAYSASGTRDTEITVQARSMDGSLELDRAVERSSAILDSGGGVVAFGLGGNRAASLEPVVPWLRHVGARELAAVQEELRNMDPGLILEAQTMIFADMDTAPETIREALAEIRRASSLATDPEMVRKFIEAEKYGLQRLVLALARPDPDAAILALREGLNLFPDDPILLSQAVQLMVVHGEPLEAVAHFRELLLLQPERAGTAAEALSRGLESKGVSFVKEGRFEDGLQLLSTAAELFPRRADLRMNYAQALAAAGQHQPALAQAQEAARLDPAYERQLAVFRRNARPRGIREGSRRSEIPFDPATNVIRADVRIGGFPVQLVVDTGASITIVPVDLAKRLSLIDGTNRGVRVQTASGMAEGLLVELPNLQIGKMEIMGLQAIALDLPNSLRGKGLLGMNALSQMNVEIDSERGRLILGGKR
jgi:clan AA aspartic protease (TIGR02281 family)